MESGYQYIKVSTDEDGVVSVVIDVPGTKEMPFNLFLELRDAFKEIHKNPDARCVLLYGEGEAFSDGFQFDDAIAKIFDPADKSSDDFPRKASYVADRLQELQDGAAGPENCKYPVIAAIHGYEILNYYILYCRGTAIDLICTTDIRLTTKDCKFALAEANAAVCSDLGPFQRIPKITGNESWLRELIFTCREFDGAEALEKGFVSHAYDTKDQLFEEARKMAKTIASKSPIGIIGAKKTLLYARDHSVSDGLAQIRQWNAIHLMSKDVGIALKGLAEGTTPKFDSF